jgi:hypothetical protein
VFFYALKSDFLKERNDILDLFFLVLISFISIILFGSRGYDVGTDTPHYIQDFNRLMTASSFFEALNTKTSYSTKDPFFNILTFYSGKLLGLRGYFYLLAILFVIPFAISVTKISKANRSVLMLGFLGLIAFPNMGINILRSGLSLSFALLAITLFLEKKYFSSTIIAIFSFLFHFSSILIIVAFLITFIKLPLALFLIAVTISLGISYGGFGIENLPIIGDFILTADRLSGYISGERGPESQLSVFIITLYIGSLVFGVNQYQKLEDHTYLRLIKVYCILTSFYLLTFNLSFSYRFGFIASVFIPIIISYPFLNYRTKIPYQFLLAFGLIGLIGLLSIYRTGY